MLTEKNELYIPKMDETMDLKSADTNIGTVTMQSQTMYNNTVQGFVF